MAEPQLIIDAVRDSILHHFPECPVIPVDVRATRAEHSRRFLSLDYVIKYVTTHLQEIPQRIR